MTLAQKIDQPAVPQPVVDGWYAAYTHARHEKKVAQQLEQRGIEHFLPLYRSVRRWKDRRKELDLVLFPGYVFVRVPVSQRLRVLQLPGVSRFVTFNGHLLHLSETTSRRCAMLLHMVFTLNITPISTLEGGWKSSVVRSLGREAYSSAIRPTHASSFQSTQSCVQFRLKLMKAISCRCSKA